MSDFSVASFIDRTQNQDRGEGLFELETERLLEINLDGSVWIKMGAMISYSGNIKFTREDNLIYIIPLAFIVFFSILWFCITRLLKWVARFGPLEVREFDLGEKKFHHTFSSATINWVNFNALLTITGHQSGLLIKNMGLFGGGSHWIPRPELKVQMVPGVLGGKLAVFEYRGVKFKIRGSAGADIVQEYSN